MDSTRPVCVRRRAPIELGGAALRICVYRLNEVDLIEAHCPTKASYATPEARRSTPQPREFEDLVALVAQNVSVEIRPSERVAFVGVLNEYPTVAVPGGMQVEVGDAYSEEARHLHGSIGWVRQADGYVIKRRLRDMRAEGMIEAWAQGRVEAGPPSVVLGDMKTRVVARYPFAVMYQELRRCLRETRLVVVGGYGLGDRPLNLALAECLAGDRTRRMLIWHPSQGRDVFIERLRIQLPEEERAAVQEEQVRVEAVVLPDADAVASARREA